MTKVSVIIPAFNAMQYLPEAWNSVKAQTFKDWELIIVNDGSSDHIQTWAAELLDPRVKIISQRNQGKSLARNRGILDSAGEYIAFLDADDLWDQTKLEKQVRKLEDCPESGLIYTWTTLINQEGKPTGTVVQSSAEGDVLKDIVQLNLLGCGSTPLIRRDCFSKVGLFEPALPLGQDWDMWIRIAAQFPFSVIQEPLVFYRQHRGNSSANWSLMENCRNIVLERAFKAYPERLRGMEAKTYGASNLYLGWLAIRTNEPQRAFALWQRACGKDPSLYFSRDAIRLLIACSLLLFLGATMYRNMVEFAHTLLNE